MENIRKLGHIDKAFFRDIARIVDDLVDNPVNKKHFSERLKTFLKKREQFYRSMTKCHEAAENPKLHLSEEELKKHLAGEKLRPPQKDWLIDVRSQSPQTSPLRKALSDANIDYSRLLSLHSSPLMRKALSDSIKELSDLNIDLPSSLKKELSGTNVEPDSDKYRKLFDTIKTHRPDLIDSSFDARNASPLMFMAKIGSALDLEALENTSTIYFWRPPLPFNPDHWLFYYYGSGKQVVSSGPERPESKVDRLACQYALLAIIHDKGLEELASDEWFTTADDEPWAKPLWTKISSTGVSPDDSDDRERRTRIEQALATVKAELAKLKSTETKQKVKRNMLMIDVKSSQGNWEAIKSEYDISKKDFGKKINFVKDSFKRKVVFRDVEHAFVLASQGFSKPAIILAGGVIEELLRLYLDHKKTKVTSDRFVDYIKACEDNSFLKRGVLRLTDSVRDFRNLVHLANEKAKRHTISKATAKGAVSSIFTIANDFQ